MGNTIPKKKYLAKFNLLFSLLICGTLLVVTADSSYAVTQTQISSGLSAAVGIALDEANNHLYFVEYNAPNLKRIVLTPECEDDISTPCAIETIPIVPGFSHAEDIQLDIEHGFAYVTTRDNPGTGGLWKVDIATGVKTLVTFNLGAPQQLVLDLSHNRAYSVGYDDGRLRMIDLTTGVKIPLFTTLDHPIGLAVTNDGTYAYVSEQAAAGGRISKIDLTTGLKVGEVATGLTAPFFLAWTDITQNSLYVVERDPANKVTRVDLITSTKNDAVTGLPWRPSGIVVKSNGTPAYITSDSEITKVDLISLVGPVFMGVGHVPATEIDPITGYATTAPGYFYQVKDSPFGGTLNIFGNLTNFETLGATHYVVMVSKDGGAFESLSHTWKMYKWNTVTFKYDLVTVAPDAVMTVGPTTKYLYRIPLEGDSNYHPEFWYPSFLFMRRPTGENGLYTFQVEIYQESGATFISPPGSLPGALNSLTLRVDNTPQEAEILSIRQNEPPEKEIQPCDIVNSGNNAYKFKITAYDPNQHLLSYNLVALWGNNKSQTIYSDSYANHLAGAPYWSGVINTKVPAVWWPAKCNCAHTFYLKTWKRTINGYNYILRRNYHKSITINNVSAPDPALCP